MGNQIKSFTGSRVLLYSVLDVTGLRQSQLQTFRKNFLTPANNQPERALFAGVFAFLDKNMELHNTSIKFETFNKIFKAEKLAKFKDQLASKFFLLCNSRNLFYTSTSPTCLALSTAQDLLRLRVEKLNSAGKTENQLTLSALLKWEISCFEGAFFVFFVLKIMKCQNPQIILTVSTQHPYDGSTSSFCRLLLGLARKELNNNLIQVVKYSFAAALDESRIQAALA